MIHRLISHPFGRSCFGTLVVTRGTSACPVQPCCIRIIYYSLMRSLFDKACCQQQLGLFLATWALSQGWFVACHPCAKRAMLICTSSIKEKLVTLLGSSVKSFFPSTLPLAVARQSEKIPWPVLRPKKALPASHVAAHRPICFQGCHLGETTIADLRFGPHRFLIVILTIVTRDLRNWSIRANPM